MNYTYLLRCADQSFYCGWTNDLSKRMTAHQNGTASKYTRSKRPVTLVLAIITNDPSTARRVEALIKRLSKKKKEALVSDPEYCTSWLQANTDASFTIINDVESLNHF